MRPEGQLSEASHPYLTHFRGHVVTTATPRQHLGQPLDLKSINDGNMNSQMVCTVINIADDICVSDVAIPKRMLTMCSKHDFRLSLKESHSRGTSSQLEWDGTGPSGNLHHKETKSLYLRYPFYGTTKASHKIQGHYCGLKKELTWSELSKYTLSCDMNFYKQV